VLLVGVVVIGVGVWLITTDRAPTSPQRGAPPSGMAVGVVLALVAAVGWSASTVLIKPALQEVDAIVTSTLRLPFATLILLLIASRSRMIDSRRLVITWKTGVWLLFAGLLSVVSATLFLWSVEVVGAARTAALTSVSPIFSASIAVAFLGERITPRLALGMGVSLGGVALIALAR
jgi:O-acetylserine/cysteine efflux transporter